MTRKRYTLLMLAVFAVVFAFSVFLEAGHDCSGNGCSVCLEVQAIRLALSLVTLAAVLLESVGASLAHECTPPVFCTRSDLVALCVKLSR